MSWNTKDIPSQKGRIALITGANSGLGFETAKVLLHKGATVIMCCRSMAKGEEARKKLFSTIGQGSIELQELDLADLNKVNQVANDILRKYERLDLLINNAGIMAPPRILSSQGYEIQFAVNHLAHMALTQKLLPLIKETKSSRIVTVTSAVQFFAKINWDDLQGERKYDRWASYSQSKLANVMFALQLDIKLKGRENRPLSLLAHPGLAKTNLQLRSANLNGSWQESFAYKLMDPFFQSARMGALPQLMAATFPFVEGGEQFAPYFNFRGIPKKSRITPTAFNSEQRERLWHVSEKLLMI